MTRKTGTIGIKNKDEIKNFDVPFNIENLVDENFCPSDSSSKILKTADDRSTDCRDYAKDGFL